MAPLVGTLQTRFTVVAVLMMLAVIPGVTGRADAVPVLDQSFDPTTFIFFGLGGSPSGPIELAQTFTVGLDGVLSRVDVKLQEVISGASDVFLDVRPTVGGVPVEDNGAALATATIPAASIDGLGFVETDISSFGVAVNPGDVLAIVLRTEPVAGFETFPSYFWQCCPDAYPLGQLFFRFEPFPTWRVEPSADVGFRTFVDIARIGEPSTFLLLATGLAGLGATAWRRRRRR